MPSVIFHASGVNFDAASLAETNLHPYKVYRVGEKSKLGRREFIYKDSGFSIDLGPDEKEDLATQIDAATQFIEKNYHTIQNLSGLDDLRFDFGYCQRRDAEGHTVVVQCDYFSPEFLRKCGELKVGIELSLYPQSEEE